jgi:2-iminobutanoate/2-iminopropanoate deaminase
VRSHTKTAMKLIFSILLAPMLYACVTSYEKGVEDNSDIVFINAELSPPLGPYSSVVRAGGLLFTSGIISFDAEKGAFAAADIGAQTEQVFDNLEAVLASAGVGLGDLVKITVYLKNPSDVSAMNAVYEQRLGNFRPARTTVPGADWGRDDILIEIDAIAVCRVCTFAEAMRWRE